MTPFEISILLHYATSGSDFRNGDFSAPILLPTIEEFVATGLLARSEPEDEVRYRATDATAAYLAAICGVPAPVLRWVIPDEPIPYRLTEAGKAMAGKGGGA